jgi:carbon-monoxide dehydrogenase catalytic subunit
MPEEPKPQLIREKLDVCELDKARMALLNPALIEQMKNDRTTDENAKPVLELMMKEGIETVWDRFVPAGSSRPTASVASVVPMLT